MKKLLGVIILFLSLSGNANSKDLFVNWHLELSSGDAYVFELLGNNVCLLRGSDSYVRCSCTNNGNKVYINFNNSVFTLEGSKSFFSNKVKGKWKSTGSNSSGIFWGHEEKR